MYCIGTLGPSLHDKDDATQHNTGFYRMLPAVITGKSVPSCLYNLFRLRLLLLPFVLL